MSQMASRKTQSQLRDELVQQLKVELFNNKVQLTPDLDAKILAKAVEKYPYALDEVPGFTSKAVLTVEEITALAVAANILSPQDAHAWLNNNGRGHVYWQTSDDAGHRTGDGMVMSSLEEEQVRESVVRRTDGTEWAKYGLVTLYRENKDYGKKDTTKDMLDEILGE